MPAFAGPLLRLAVIAGLAGSGAAMAAEDRAVIELFTSQGCSACPPADALIKSLTREHPDLVTLTFPVDYWDYIGWKDTLAMPAFTARQKAYAAARGDNHVYTPQAVVNGLTQVVGSDKDQVEAAIASSAGQVGALRVSLTATPTPDGVSVNVGGAPPGAPRWGSFWIYHVAHERSVTIGRGENSGKTIAYVNVVRHMKKIGDWGGEPVHYEIRKDDLAATDSDSYVLILQASSGGKPGPILAVAKSP